MKRFLGLFLLFVGVQSSTCHKQPCETTYHFEIPFSITERDSFRIGDTIWLSSQISDNLVDKTTNQSIDVSKFDFQIRCGMYRMDTTQFDEAEKYFEFINKTGKMEMTIASTIDTKLVYQKETNSSSRVVKIGMIPKKIGIFKISFANLTDDITNVKLTQSNCIESLKFLYTMNEGREFNYYLLKNNLLPFPILTEEAYKKEGNYVFKIIK
jgi:hypothetical protein